MSAEKQEQDEKELIIFSKKCLHSRNFLLIFWIECRVLNKHLLILILNKKVLNV